MSLYKTYLFKELKKAYGKTNEWEEIKKNLHLVKKDCKRKDEFFNPNETLIYAFSWDVSPQGGHYWHRIYMGLGY